MIYIGTNELININLQMALTQLCSKYERLSSEYQNIANQKQFLQVKAQSLQKQNQELRSKMAELSAQNYATNHEISQGQNDQGNIQITTNLHKKNHKKGKKLQYLQTNDSLDYACTYEGCYRVYKSAVSMNMHIKIKHNGGTKKQRQEYAKMIIDAEERGESPPQIPITLPTHFIEQFRTSYTYMKKYCM